MELPKPQDLWLDSEMFFAKNPAKPTLRYQKNKCMIYGCVIRSLTLALLVFAWQPGSGWADETSRTDAHGNAANKSLVKTPRTDLATPGFHRLSLFGPETSPKIKIISPSEGALVGEVESEMVVWGEIRLGWYMPNRILVYINQNVPVQASIYDLAGKTIKFRASVRPRLGPNTLAVRAGNSLLHSSQYAESTREFTFERRYKLSLKSYGSYYGSPFPEPSNKKGDISTKVLNGKKIVSLPGTAAEKHFSVSPGTTIQLTARPKAGCLFHEFDYFDDAETIQADGETCIITMPSNDLVVGAHFIRNPFTAPEEENAFPCFFQGAKKVFQGNFSGGHMDDAGMITAAFSPGSATLSGKVMMRGKTTPFTAVLKAAPPIHSNISVLFRNKGKLTEHFDFLNLRMTMTWSLDQLEFVITEGDDGFIEGVAAAPAFAPRRPVPEEWLNERSDRGYYAMALPIGEPAGDSDLSLEDYPQGSGFAGLFLTKSGELRIAGQLADGSQFTGSGFLSKSAHAKWKLFVPLPLPGGGSWRGSLVGDIEFDGGAADSDPWLFWYRPQVEETHKPATQIYTKGWAAGMTLSAYANLYDSRVKLQDVFWIEEVLPGGNMCANFDFGKLLAEDYPQLTQPFNLRGDAFLKVPGVDPGLHLKFVRRTGAFTGTFTPDWPVKKGRLPKFSGMVTPSMYALGMGFFISNIEDDKDPQSGKVWLEEIRVW